MLQPRARRKGVLWAPLDELRAPVLLSTNELLWLPRSPDPRPAMGRAEKATRTSPVSEQVRLRCFCAHFLHSNRAVALLMPKIRLPQAAEGLLIPSCLFGPGRAETNRPSFLSLRPFCLFALPSQQQHQEEGSYQYSHTSQGQIADICDAVFMQSARCDKTLSNWWRHSRNALYAQSNALQDLTCEYIDNMRMGKFDSEGNVIMDANRLYLGEGEAQGINGNLIRSIYRKIL